MSTMAGKLTDMDTLTKHLKRIGSLGGIARAQKTTKAQRSEWARMGTVAREANKLRKDKV